MHGVFAFQPVSLLYDATMDTDKQTETPPSMRRLLLDFFPLAAFFVGFKLGGVALATWVMVIATAATLAVIYITEKRIALLPLISGICVLVFGSLTIALDSELFIKLRPTVVNLLFASVLLVGVYGFRQGWLKHIMSFAFQLTDAGWLTLSKRWAFLFFSLAAINEIVWRHFPTDIWVNVKVFGFVGLTLLFSLAQVPLIEREALKREPSHDV